MPPVFVLNGPNLNLLGTRKPEVYGTTTLADVADRCRAEGGKLGLDVDFRQSNHEGVLIDWIHEAIGLGAPVVGNFGAYTHTSIAIMDALDNVEAPVIEVHISDIHAREEFRHTSYVSLVATEVIVGQGVGVGLVDELGEVHPDDDQLPGVLLLERAELVEHVQAVDAAVGPEVEQQEAAAEVREAVRRAAGPQPAPALQLGRANAGTAGGDALSHRGPGPRASRRAAARGRTPRPPCR